MQIRFRRPILLLAGFLWCGAVSLGLTRLWSYGAAAGAPAQAPTSWPIGTNVGRVLGVPTVVLFMHPRCPCSRATAEELSRLITETGEHSLDVVVLFTR